MNHCQIELRSIGEDAPPALRAYLADRFDRALLVLGDLEAPLRPRTLAWAAWGSGEEPRGACVRFEGFSTPILSLVSDDAVTAQLLFARARDEGPGVLACHACEPILTIAAGRCVGEDRWMTRRTEPLGDGGTEPLGVAASEALRGLYASSGTGFWAAEMLGFGHHWALRTADGALLSASGVSFVLAREGYGQVANVATLPAARRQGLASRCVRATIHSLHEAGVPRCGLFADVTDDALERMYTGLGFRESNRFKFVQT